MRKHAAESGECVRDQARRPTNILAEYDATTLVGLKTIVLNAAIEHVDGTGESSLELPKLPQLLAAAAMARCLIPVRLKGYEIKAIRKIMGMTLKELAERLDGKTAVETVSRWESDVQPMGGYAEKVLRLLVCEELKNNAPGVAYNGSMISYLNLIDPWRVDPNYELPPLMIQFGRLKELSGEVIETWGTKLAA